MDQSLPNRKGKNQQRITLIITFKLAKKKKKGYYNREPALKKNHKGST